MRRFLATVCTFTCAWASQPGSRQQTLDLVTVKRKVAESLTHLPDYTCLETIERSERQLESASFKAIDAVRLEVTQIGAKEFYSALGDHKFQDGVTQLVGTGLISTGQFALTARSIFVDTSPQIRFAGEGVLKSRRVLKYDYRIPYLARGWTLTFGAQSVTVAAHGSFWADAATLDLVRLDKQADDIPPDLMFSEARTAVDYGRVRIGDIEVLLPQSAEVTLTLQNHETYINRAEFSQCRAYRAESSIRFGDVPEAQAFKLPPNLAIVLELDRAIDPETAAEGDAVTARVALDVKVKNQIVIPSGAMVRGRIREMNSFSITLEFAEVEFGNQRAVFTARLEQAGHPAKVMRGAALPGVGTLSVDALPAGFRTTWRTLVN
jgi:hypothetical protein